LPFVGAYVAQSRGYFSDLGLTVDIKHATAGEHLQALLDGAVQVTTADGSSVLKRNEQGLGLVSIALIGQKSEQGFAVLQDSGIQSVADWAGKTFGYKTSVPPEFLAIARANNLNPDLVRQVRVGFDPRILTERQVDILAVFVSNEPGQLLKMGVRTRVFDANEFGIESLGLSYVSTPELVQQDPDALGRFVRAVLKGIEFADQNREEALDIVMSFAPQEDRELQKFMMTTELERARTELTVRNGVGFQTQEQWQRYQQSLLEFGGISRQFDVSRVFTDRFVRAAYQDGKLVWP
jgi:ABC-type nitrate/sulfonate/bicarbonate transport system substrate-binding protein